jgi:hypothetical protein
VGEPFGLDRRGRLLAALALGRRFALDPVLSRVRQPLGLVFLGVGALADGGVELQLLALDLLLGDPDVLDLELHLPGLDGLGVGDVHLPADVGHLEAQVLLRVCDLGVDRELLLLLVLAR